MTYDRTTNIILHILLCVCAYNLAAGVVLSLFFALSIFGIAASAFYIGVFTVLRTAEKTKKPR